MLKQIKGSSPSIWKATVGGIATAVVTAFLTAAILATLLDREILEMEKVGYGIMAGHLTAVILGTRNAAGKAGHMGQAAAAVTAGGYYLLLLVVNALFFGGAFTGMGMTLILVLLGTVAAVLMAGKGSGKRGRRRYKIPN